ncbi:cobalamin biosynthesis protein [Pseudomonas chengduensis]|nr:cobalamin biosynthesis protein [Pseudomonas chengduensis]MDH0624687.1 cobalamin biosynthesis protein [Pseudomonas chengduensis]MDH1667933.1 cobalamin biosynthesis protein [Pseudomonas chengduensis]MDH1683571.1 cobalamin biosynthesis protein [Pseudomonas chengduensis]
MLPTASDRPSTSPIKVVAGLGCRRGCSQDELLDLLIHSLVQHELTVDNLAGLASIAHKRDEAGLHGLAEHLALELVFFAPEQLSAYLAKTGGNPLSQATTGSPAVAEPCALALAANMGIAPRRLGERTRSASATCALATFTDTSI